MENGPASRTWCCPARDFWKAQKYRQWTNLNRVWEISEALRILNSKVAKCCLTQAQRLEWSGSSKIKEKDLWGMIFSSYFSGFLPLWESQAYTICSYQRMCVRRHHWGVSLGRPVELCWRYFFSGSLLLSISLESVCWKCKVSGFIIIPSKVCAIQMQTVFLMNVYVLKR